MLFQNMSVGINEFDEAPDYRKFPDLIYALKKRGTDAFISKIMFFGLFLFQEMETEKKTISLFKFFLKNCFLYFLFFMLYQNLRFIKIGK